MIEAAGNGNLNLDSIMTVGGARSLNIKSTKYQDSGAIMVGACGSRVVESGRGYGVTDATNIPTMDRGSTAMLGAKKL